MEKEKSYYLIYQGDIKKALSQNDINRYVILNNQLAAIYVDYDFDDTILNQIIEIKWWSESFPLSSLIDITEDIKNGESITVATGTEYITNNPYLTVTGKDILIAVIDSGVDYLHKDLINADGSSKILYMWDQENNTATPPKGMIFGSEFNKADINKAIKENNNTLSTDEVGTGTMVAGILVGEGNINKQYRGICVDSQLVVVKLRSYENLYYEGKINYTASDFLSAITYVIDIAMKEKKSMIINLTLGAISESEIEASILDTYPIFNKAGIIIVGGAGNQGNTDIHYEGKFESVDEEQDIIIQNGENHALDIVISGTGPDKIGAQLISPSGELSQIINYSPDDYVYVGKFNIENTSYRMQYLYPWIKSGEQNLEIKLNNTKPGIWTIRLKPESIISGVYNVYLPNKNLISEDTRFLDPKSTGTITMFGVSDGVITVGAYNDKTNSIWIGSSKGSLNNNEIKPDIVAPGVDIISTYMNNSYNTATGSGVSSTIVCGVLSLTMEYLTNQSKISKIYLFNEVLKSYLMIGTTRKEIYQYPNVSQGYGILNLKNLFKQISNNL